MFKLNEFIKRGLIDAVGHLADYQIIHNAAGWHEKGVLTEKDLMDIHHAIEKQYISLSPEPIEEVPIEEEPAEKPKKKGKKEDSNEDDIEIKEV